MANILLLGDPGVGKTTWIDRVIGKKFSDSYMTTLGKNMEEINIEGRKIFLHDMSGNERFQEINVYYEIADGALIFYDVSSKNSFERINYWKSKLNKNVPLVLIGNKADLLKDRLNFISCKEDKHIIQPLLELIEKIPYIEHNESTILDWVMDFFYYYFSLYSTE